MVIAFNFRFDLGTLYESCENQQSDALDAYTKALEIDPNNALIKQRIQYLKNPNNGENPPQLQPQQPAPQDTAPPKYPNAGGSAPVNFRVSQFNISPLIYRKDLQVTNSSNREKLARNQC